MSQESRPDVTGILPGCHRISARIRREGWPDGAGILTFFVLIDHVEPLQKIWELLDFCFKIPLAVIYLGFFGIIVLPIWAVFFD